MKENLGLGEDKMNGLKNLRSNVLKHLKLNILSLKINKLKYLIPTNGSGDNKEIEFKISQLQKAEERQSKKISESPSTEKISPLLDRNVHSEMSDILEAETNALQKEDTEISEKIDSRKDVNPNKPLESKETGEIEGTSITEIRYNEETKSANEKEGLSNIREKNEGVISPENTGKTKTVNPGLEKNEKVKERKPENSKTEKTPSIIFGGSLIEELLESDDLCSKEDLGFIKYIEESSVTDLIVDLKEVKELLTETRP